MKQSLVSICCITYNHASLIRRCLDGFLMQMPPSAVAPNAQLGDWLEILIHDDASTDGTTEIIKEYAAKYPDVIFPMYENENQYTRGGAGKMELFNYNRAHGTYMAYCEGDDFWTDAHKLQKQVDFLEAHPEYSVCWHRCKQMILETSEYRNDECGDLLQGREGIDIDLDTYFSKWYTQPLSMVFRFALFDPHCCEQYRYYRDEHEQYHLLKKGKGYLFAFEGGVYVKHGGGMFTSMSDTILDDTCKKVAQELYYVNKDEYTKRFYETVLQRQIYWMKDAFMKKFMYSWELFRLQGDLKQLIKNIVR